MSKEEEKIVKDLGSIQKNIFFILKEKGHQILLDYLIGIKWQSIKFSQIAGKYYMPEYFKDFIEAEKMDVSRFGIALDTFKKYLTDQAVKNLDQDWYALNPQFTESLSNIHLVFKEYFMEKLNYMKIHLLFEFQYKNVNQIINNLYRSLPPNLKAIYQNLIKEKAEAKKNQPKTKEKPKAEIVFYKLNKDEILDPNFVPIKFELLFDCLNDIKIQEISYSELKGIQQKMDENFNFLQSQYEKETKPEVKKKLENQLKSFKKNRENYYRQEYRLKIEQFRKQIQRIMRKVEVEAIKYTKKIMKIVYDYEQNLVREYGKRGGIFG